MRHPAPSNAAKNQRALRKRAEDEFGAKPLSLLVTAAEANFLLRAFMRKYGFKPTLSERRKHDIRIQVANERAAAAALASGKQQELDLLEHAPS
jgi:hypothetical protein